MNNNEEVNAQDNNGQDNNGQDNNNDGINAQDNKTIKHTPPNKTLSQLQYTIEHRHIMPNFKQYLTKTLTYYKENFEIINNLHSWMFITFLCIVKYASEVKDESKPEFSSVCYLISFTISLLYQVDISNLYYSIFRSWRIMGQNGYIQTLQTLF